MSSPASSSQNFGPSSQTLLGSSPMGSPLNRSGWVEKYSVGRGFFPVRNWKRRWLMVNHHGLNYSKDPKTEPQTRTFIPFTENSEKAKEGQQVGKGRKAGDVKLRPVFLYPNVTAAIHSEATDANYFYFGVRFEESETPRILLLRTTDGQERDAWVRFIAQFVHAASILSGVPMLHPVAMKNAKPDPEELDPKSQADLRRAVIEWDDGFQHRVDGTVAPDVVESAPVNWDSDPDDIDLGGSSKSDAGLSSGPASGQGPMGRVERVRSREGLQSSPGVMHLAHTPERRPSVARPTQSSPQPPLPDDDAL